MSIIKKDVLHEQGNYNVLVYPKTSKDQVEGLSTQFADIEQELNNTKQELNNTKQELNTIRVTASLNSEDIIDLDNKKQNNLVSGTNIKTINGQSVLGAGDLVIESGGGSKLYRHFIKIIQGVAEYYIEFSFLSSSDTPTTNIRTLLNTIFKNHSDPHTVVITTPATNAYSTGGNFWSKGCVMFDSNDNYKIFYSEYTSNTTVEISDGIAGSSNSYSDYTDIVEEL